MLTMVTLPLQRHAEGETGVDGHQQYTENGSTMQR